MSHVPLTIDQRKSLSHHLSALLYRVNLIVKEEFRKAMSTVEIIRKIHADEKITDRECEVACKAWEDTKPPEGVRCLIDNSLYYSQVL